MKFTQFVFPHGSRKDVEIERPDEIEKLAEELFRAGYRFEIECHPGTQMVHGDCSDDEGCLAVFICQNGPEVPGEVDELVREAHAAWRRVES